MSKRTRLFIFLAGLWIFFAFGFRLYILFVRWETDPTRLKTLAVALIFVAIGGFLIQIARLKDRAGKQHYLTLSSAAFFMILYWGNRLFSLLLYPTIDPNPRAHLHLSVTFLVVGFVLLSVGFKGWRSQNQK